MLLANILKKLKYSNDYVSADSLSKELNVSKRTIQSKVKLLNREGEKNGFKIKTAYGRGYYLETYQGDKFSEFYRSLYSEYDFKNEKKLILKQLLFLIVAGNKYSTVEDLADFLRLSKTFVFSKLDSLEKYLQSYNLLLIRKSHYGIKISGANSDILRLIQDLYERNNDIRNVIDQTIGNFDWVDVWVKTRFRNGNKVGSYYQYHRVLIFLRCLIYYKLKFSTNDEEASHINSKYKLELINQLEEKYQLSFTDEDVQELSILNNLFMPKNIAIEIDENDLEKNLIQFVKEIDLSEGTNYSRDRNFVPKLKIHLLSLFKRINLNITYKNPMLMEISVKYPLVFDITLRFYIFLRQKYDYKISNDELGFIALYFLKNFEEQRAEKLEEIKHIAVICTTGGILSELTKKRVSKFFPEAHIETFAFYDSNKMIEFNPDVVLSMIPVNQDMDVPIIYINELLTDDDLKEIRERFFLQDDDLLVSQKGEVGNFLNFIKKDLVSNFKPDLYNRILRRMGEQLIEKGYGEPGIVQNILIRENLMSTIYKNGIAIPHPIEMNAKNSTISVGIIQGEENKNNARLVFLINLAKRDREFYSSISNNLYFLMNNESDIQKIMNEPSYDTILEVLKNGAK